MFMVKALNNLEAGDGTPPVKDSKPSMVSGQGYWRPVRSAWGCSHQQRQALVSCVCPQLSTQHAPPQGTCGSE